MKFWQRETPILDYILGAILGSVIVITTIGILVAINEK